MKQILVGLCLLLLTMDCNSGQQTESGTQEEIIAAKAAIKELADTLQAELKNAMQTGGPVAAIGVCSTQAIPITQTVAVDRGITMGRVSLANRNPVNLPNEWQAAVLQDFEQRKSNGEDIGSLAWSETVDVGGEREFRFMKAIPTGAVCLSCHGTELAPEISEVLAVLYPDDRATGFSEGDIRGAFVVTGRSSD